MQGYWYVCSLYKSDMILVSFGRGERRRGECKDNSFVICCIMNDVTDV